MTFRCLPWKSVVDMKRFFARIDLLKDKEIEMLDDCPFIDQLVLRHNSSFWDNFP
jgi:hypothetical protein